MTVLFIIVLSGAGVVLYILLAPFSIEIDSSTSVYLARFHILAKAQLCATRGSLFLDMQIAGWHTKKDLLGRQEKQSVRRRAGGKNIFQPPAQKIYAVIKSFKLAKCFVSVDTGDMALNGILYPWFFWVGKSLHRDVQINFQNENKIILKVENNFLRILRAYITYSSS